MVKLNSMETYNIYKSVGMRALRGFIAGFIATAATISLNNVSTWAELGSALANLVLASIVGGITGAILALDKAVRA